MVHHNGASLVSQLLHEKYEILKLQYVILYWAKLYVAIVTQAYSWQNAQNGLNDYLVNRNLIYETSENTPSLMLLPGGLGPKV
jgi:hypothetical protein